MFPKSFQNLFIVLLPSLRRLSYDLCFLFEIYARIRSLERICCRHGYIIHISFHCYVNSLSNGSLEYVTV